MSTPKKFSFKEALIKLKAHLGLEDVPAAADPAAADAEKDYSTDSGTKLKIDKLEVGGVVYLEDGTTAVTSGFTLADGTAVEVDDKGVITKVTVPGADPVAEGTPEMVAMRAAAAKFATGTPEERTANLETMCQAMMRYCFGWKIDDVTNKTIEEQAIAVYKSLGTAQFSAQLETEKIERKKDAAKFTEAMQQMLAIVEKFADEPAADPAQPPANTPPAPSKKERATALLRAATETTK